MGRSDRVRLRGGDKLARFAETHNDAKNALESWATIIETTRWKRPADLKRTFGSASFVEGKTAFNIGGNKYRLISQINYELKTVLVTHVLTHKEYDKDKWK
ncbi:MAG: type II toxin-antitoxin system HigB family toxin [Bryobacteraceae bacterium]|jgi:mRNA interferase HigB